MLVCLMSFTLEPLEPKEASKEEPKEAGVTPLFSKDLADFPGYPSGSNMFRKSAYRDDPERRNTGCGCTAYPCSTLAQPRPTCESPGIADWPTRASLAGGPIS